MNEGESATDLEWYSIWNITTYKWHILKYAQLVLAYETQKWLKLQTARIHKFFYCVRLVICLSFSVIIFQLLYQG